MVTLNFAFFDCLRNEVKLKDASAMAFANLVAGRNYSEAAEF